MSNGFSTSETADIINGLQEWFGVGGIRFDFLSASPGPDVITVQAGTNLPSIEFAIYSYGGSGVAPNQITGRTIGFQLNYVDPVASYSAYDPNAPNADSYLSGTAAHGLGHILGLNDVGNAGLSTQTSTSVVGGQIGPNNNGFQGTPPAPTSNTPTDCDKSSVRIQSAANTSSASGGSSNSGGDGGSGSDGYGGGSGGGGCYSSGYTYWDDTRNSLTYYYPTC